MKNNISYYKHETTSHNSWKFKQLRRAFGWAGEGRFWALNNRIARSEDCKLNLKNIGTKEEIADDLGLDMTELIEFIEYLKVINLVIDEDNKGLITTNIVAQELIDQREFICKKVAKFQKKLKNFQKKLKNFQKKLKN